MRSNYTLLQLMHWQLGYQTYIFFLKSLKLFAFDTCSINVMLYTSKNSYLALLVRVVLLETNVPRQAAHRRDGLELVYRVARNEVDVVVAKKNARVADSVATHLVQLGVIYPCNTLQRNNNNETIVNK